jgi:hypothetical protein
LVRFHTTTSCPSRRRDATMAAPIRPVPRKAIRPLT